jgi:hypothetical protein
MGNRSMNTRHKQRGLGIFGLIFLLALIGFVALVIIKCAPLYLNQATIKRDLHEVARQINTSGSELDIGEVRRDIEKRFDIDYINQLEAKDVQVRRTQQGVVMSYDYEARANLFSNVFIVIHFAEDIPLRVNVVG